MSIRVVCPNGHELNVKDAFAGKSGLCPMCKARVVVPRVPKAELSEDAILKILGTHDGSRSHAPTVANVPTGDGDAPVPPATAPSEPVQPRPRIAPKTPKKICIQCDREIDAATHICPFCHTYIAGLKDFG